MEKENFNWKSLFVNDEDNNSNSSVIGKQEPVPLNAENKFPQPAEQTSTADSSVNPFLKEVFEIYDKGFESLNEPGFDFFELYKSVLVVGVTNPQSYQMAFTMGKSINSDLTKDFLIQKANFYLAEIEKVYEKYNALGKSKKQDLDNNITKEKYNLSKSITDLEANILQLQKELEGKKMELQKMDPANRKELTEIQLKIEANDLAREKLLSSINTVITGINQYL
jgi:hypothetical protein